MVLGGEVDRTALIESFTRIKEDIARLNKEIYDLKLDQKKLIEENLSLKSNVSATPISNELIRQIILETVKSIPQAKSRPQGNFINRINKKRRIILKNRIELLAEQKNRSLSDIKEIIVDHEDLCSKATFYRYIEKMKALGQIDLIKINDQEVMVKLN